MHWRHLAVLSLGTALWAGSSGCASAREDAAAAGGSSGASIANLGGESGSSGAFASGAGESALAGGGAAASGGNTANSCEAHSAPQRAQGTLLSLSLSPVLSDKPFVFGQPNALPDGSSVLPINFRFYISAVQLLPSSGDPIAVDLVTASGEPEPYGVHLFNAEDEASGTLRVLAPAGDYTGLSFSVGIKLACNQQPPANLDEPLTDVSQMTWPHTGGFLFLRYEGRNTPAQGGASIDSKIPTMVHMGGSIEKELVPRVSVSGSLSLPDNGTLDKSLNVSMDELFSGASADIDVSDVAVGIFSSDEAIAGERLRRELPKRHVFTLTP